MLTVMKRRLLHIAMLMALLYPCVDSVRYIFTFVSVEGRQTSYYWASTDWSVCSGCSTQFSKAYGRRLVVDIDWPGLDVNQTAYSLFSDNVLQLVELDKVVSALDDVIGMTDIDVIAQYIIIPPGQPFDQWSLAADNGAVKLQSIWDTYGKGLGSTIALLDSGISSDTLHMVANILPGIIMPATHSIY
jgi:hypothetical protein